MQTRTPISWKAFIPLLIVLVVAGGLRIQAYFSRPTVPTATVPSVTHDEVVSSDNSTTPTPTPGGVALPPALVPSIIPTAPPVVPPPSAVEFNLSVPFSSQAPFMKWDAYHEETCEEASLLMAVEYYQGTKAETLDPQFAEDEYAKMTDIENSLGYGLSMTSAETVATLEKYSDKFTARVIDNPTVDELKALIKKGDPIVAPAAGRKLGNPFFTGEGPLYHMLVIRGYTKDTFITNDPGTRHGENYSYNTSVFMNAIGDWNSGDPEHGAKRVIVLEPK
ncbi:MAG: C39 family peptidase [Patescibacteria group bacterium]|jgi:hypothetical protein